jgi:hypothetical protein
MTVDKLITFTNVLPSLPLTIQVSTIYGSIARCRSDKPKCLFINLSEIFVLTNKSHIVMSPSAALWSSLMSNGLHKSRIL